MGCGPAQPEMTPAEQSKLHIYGDYFNTETRALLIIAKMADIDHEFHRVDLLLGENQSTEYLQHCPTGSVPMIRRGDGKHVITSGWEVFEYMLKTYAEQVKKVFTTPVQNVELQMKHFFYHDLRGMSSKLVRRVANIKLNPGQIGGREDKNQMTFKTVESKIYETLNGNLKKTKYLGGADATIIDVLYFCEIYQLSKHYKEPPSQFAQLLNWYEDMQKLDAVREVNNHFDNVVKEYNLKVDCGHWTPALQTRD